MTPENIDALVPKRRGDEVSPRIRKGIFVPQTVEDGQSRVTLTTIAVATRLPHFLSSRSSSRSPTPQTAEGDDEKSSDAVVPKRPYLTAASQKNRETFNHECIRSCALFADRDPAFVQQLMQDFHIQLFVDGDIIVNEGDAGDTMYFIRRGEVEVSIGEQKTVVRTLSDGSIFGELSLLGVSHKRTATVKATSFCDCRVMSHRRFKQILHGFPKEHSFFTQLAADRRHELHKAKRERKRELHNEKAKEVVEVAQKRRTLINLRSSVKVISDFFPSSSEPATRRVSWSDMTFDLDSGSIGDGSARSASASCSRHDSPRSSTGSQEASDLRLSSTWPLTSASKEFAVPKRPPSSESARHHRTHCVNPRITIGDEGEIALQTSSRIPQAPPSTPSKGSRHIRKGQSFFGKASARGLQNETSRDRSQAPKFATDVLTEVANLYDMQRVFSPDNSESPEPDDSRTSQEILDEHWS